MANHQYLKIIDLFFKNSDRTCNTTLILEPITIFKQSPIIPHVGVGIKSWELLYWASSLYLVLPEKDREDSDLYRD